MKVEVTSKFYKDASKLSKPVRLEIDKLILNVTNYESITQIPNLKKLKGFKTAYRIRMGDYRIGIIIEKNTVEFSRVLTRKDIYREWP